MSDSRTVILYISEINLNRFIRYSLFINNAKNANRNHIIDFLRTTALFERPQGISVLFNLYHRSIRQQFISALSFLQSEFRVDTDHSRGNRTEQLDILFNQALKTFLTDINFIATNIRPLTTDLEDNND